MTLSDFIESDMDALVEDWTRYARAVSPKEIRLDDAQLSNSARELLTGIAADMRETQTDAQQRAKSLHSENTSTSHDLRRAVEGQATDLAQPHGGKARGRNRHSA